MAVYKRRHVLPSAAWIDGGNIQIQVKDLPPLQRIEALVFRLEAVFTTGGAAAAIVSNQLHRLIQMLDLGPNIRGSGMFWHFLQWQDRGAEVALPAGIPATNSSAFRRFLTWRVPFADYRAKQRTDDCPVGADFNEKVISIDTSAFAGLDGGTNTWNTLASITGVLRVEALLLPETGSPGSQVQFGYADLTGQAPSVIGTALYTDLFAYRENAGTIDSAQVATIAMQGDGKAYYDQVRLSELTSRFNDLYAIGSDPQASSATVPIGGELLPEAPAVTAGAAATVTTPFLPIIYPPIGHKKSDHITVENVLRIDFTGSDTSLHVGYRRVIPHTEGSAVMAFQRLGQPVTSASQIATKTGDGRALPGRLNGLDRFLPLQRKR